MGKEIESMYSSKGVLIVEDDKSLQKLYGKFLNLLGFSKISIANNGLEAIEIYKKLPEKPDLILMDYRMPLKNGIETAREILANNNKTSKVIFLSADVSIIPQTRSLGVFSFLPKPFMFKELKAAIESALNHTTSESEKIENEASKE